MGKYKQYDDLASRKNASRYAMSFALLGIIWMLFKNQYLLKYNINIQGYKRDDLILSLLYIIITSVIIYIITYKRIEKTRMINNEMISNMRETIAIREEKQLYEAAFEEQLRHLAYYDDLTGLPNKHLLRKRLDEQFEKNSKFAILYIEIDDYKLTNESLALDDAEVLLKKVANMLFLNLGENDYLARINENEFVMIVNDNVNKEELENKSKEILNEIIMPIGVDRVTIYLSAKIGIAIYPYRSKSPNELLKEAHLALHHIRYDAEYYYAFFDDEIGNKINKENYIMTELEKAIKEESFTPYFQPISYIEDNRIIGLETLIRWIHPEKGFISPAEFIPIAEETGQIYRITDIILEKALKQKHEWNKKGFGDLIVSVNISSKSFRRGNLELKVLELLRKYEIDPKELILEITETSAIKEEDIDDIRKSFSRFKGIGIEIALDDFGTGSSSLSQLSDLPIKYIKLDGTFLRDIVDNKDDQAVVKTIIDLSKVLGLYVIAEGIETIEQRNTLLTLGCTVGQGYFLARPAAAEEIEKLFQ